MEEWKVDQDFQDFQDLIRIRGKTGRVEGWKRKTNITCYI